MRRLMELYRSRVAKIPPPSLGVAMWMFPGVFLIFTNTGWLSALQRSQVNTYADAVWQAVYGGSLAFGYATCGAYKKYWGVAAIFLAQVFATPRLYEWFQSMGITGVVAPEEMQREVRKLCVVSAVLCLAVGFAMVMRAFRVTMIKGVRTRAELELATRLHQTLVPPIAAETPLASVYGKSIASSEMGGDLVDLIVERERLDVIIADVAGHGVRAGVVMAMVKSAIRTRALHTASLGELLTDLGRVLAQMVEPGMFATAACVRLDGSGFAECALAGHLPVYHYHAATGRVTEIVNNDLPLGVDDQSVVGSQRVACESGDVFMLFTDGLQETMNLRGKHLGLAPILSELERHGKRPLPELFASIMRMVESHGKQEDDRTLVLVRVAGGGAS